MAQTLVIVESPAKAKTIEKFLGKGFKVLASYGHVRALPSKQGSVDIARDFEPKYHILPESVKHIELLKKEAAKSSELILATDLDREGEAIAWHLLEALGIAEESTAPRVKRVTFHEITKKAILKAMEEPRHIARDLVDAQQARSILDYLVGFNLSPFLWKKIRYGLSAGRVQSVALRLICDREKEIQAFDPREYWTIEADMTSVRNEPFRARLFAVGGEKLDKFAIATTAEAEALVADLKRTDFAVTAVTRSEKKRNPAAPFTTSTLQQEASRKLGFSARKTMTTAQKLYEGIDIGQGAVGLITYMRTDSVALSDEATSEAKEVITRVFGPEYALEKPRVYKSKAKNAQEAHEAVRPTAIINTPDKVKPFLSSDQHRLYSLIWTRTVASQMAAAILDATSVDIGSAPGSPRDFTFRASGQVIRFPGFMKLYIEGTDEAEEKAEGLLPLLEDGEGGRARGSLPRAALHPAPSPLHRGEPGQDPGRVRHRPPVHLRLDHEHPGDPQIRAPGKADLHSRGCRHGGQRPAGQPLPAVCRLRLHRQARRGPRRHLPRRRAVASGPARLLGAVHRPSQAEGAGSLQGRHHHRKDRQGLPRLRQTPGRQTRPVGKIPRLLRLPRMPPHRAPFRRGTGRAGALGREVREVRGPDADQDGTLRKVPGLQRLSGVQEHPAPGQAQGPRHHLPRMQGRGTDGEEEPLRQDLLLLQPLSPVQVRSLGPAGRRALPQVRPSGDRREGHQARRHLPQVSDGNLRLSPGPGRAGKKGGGQEGSGQGRGDQEGPGQEGLRKKSQENI